MVTSQLAAWSDNSTSCMCTTSLTKPCQWQAIWLTAYGLSCCCCPLVLLHKVFSPFCQLRLLCWFATFAQTTAPCLCQGLRQPWPLLSLLLPGLCLPHPSARSSSAAPRAHIRTDAEALGISLATDFELCSSFSPAFIMHCTRVDDKLDICSSEQHRPLMLTFIFGSIRLNMGAFFSMSGMMTNLREASKSRCIQRQDSTQLLLAVALHDSQF